MLVTACELEMAWSCTLKYRVSFPVIVSKSVWVILLATLLPVSAIADVARYRLELKITWSEETHPFEWPAEGGHLSDLTGVTHNSRYVMFADGHTATSGLKLIAENGRASIMQAELAEAGRRNRVGEIIYGEKLKRVPGRIVAEFDVSTEYPRLSFVTMLAPSPDWFTGAASIPLYVNGAWQKRIEGPLMAWDAGTDSGASYVAKNAESQPAESIRLAATPHFLSESGLRPVGRFVIERIR